MLRHTFTREVRILPKKLLDIVKDPVKWLKENSEYIEIVEKIGENKYRIRMKWKKFGMTKRFEVIFNVIDKGDMIAYMPTRDSPIRALFTFTVIENPDTNTVTLEVSAEMDAGTLASLLGQGDFQKFVENLIDNSIRKALLAAAKPRIDRVTCESCVFFEMTRKYCFALKREIPNPRRPPCGGKYYKKAEATAK